MLQFGRGFFGTITKAPGVGIAGGWKARAQFIVIGSHQWILLFVVEYMYSMRCIKEKENGY